MRILPLLLVPALLQGCVVGTMSERSGGHGVVLLHGRPVMGASISIADMGGTQTGTTDDRGEFRISGESRRVFYFLMENPAFHPVRLRVEAPDLEPVERAVRKSVFGNDDVDFGRIELGDR